MQKITIENDIYNNANVLILTKGQEIILTKEKINQLNHLGVLDEILSRKIVKKEETSNKEIKADENHKLPQISEHKEAMKQSISSLSKKIKKDKEMQLKKASEILGQIIYDSKGADWESHFKNLMHYVDWVYAHSINTALLSCVIGIEAGYTDERLKQLALGAVFHDIGVTLLPKKVLNKAETLTEIEIAIIRNHCEMGFSMLEDTELSEKSKLIILQHHEKNDGTGYPNGIEKEEIVEEAKIVMIVEAFDTATTRRPYKEAKSVDVVLKEMNVEKNIYDEKFVRILCEILL